MPKHSSISFNLQLNNLTLEPRFTILEKGTVYCSTKMLCANNLFLLTFTWTSSFGDQAISGAKTGTM